MAKNDPIAKADSGFATQLTTFKNNIGSYATLLGVTPAQMARQAADADFFAYALVCQLAVQDSAQAWTAWKRNLRRGGGGAADAPTLPTLPPAPAIVPDAGIEARFRALARQIKANPACNEIITRALGIEAVDHAAPDFTTLQPKLTVSIIGSAVHVDWDWGGKSVFLDAIELQVDRGDGRGFVPLAYDTTPGFTDPEPLPATPAKWSYRGIYRRGDGQAGQWSTVASIVVGR
ncbi:MAG: hypothetical protein ABI318_21745 [Chthoniobacteraceae bacterium]